MKPRSKFAVLVVLGVTALVAGSCAAQSGREVDRAVHAKLVAAAEGYETLQHQTKVIAACIDWPASTAQNIAVKRLYRYVTAIYSDAPIFTGDLMREALRACNRDRAREGWRCACVEVDKNGRAVIEVPDSFGQRAGSG